MKVVLATNHPNSIVYGGFEIQALKTFEAISASGVDIELLDWHRRDLKFDVLHLFGWSPVWWDVVEHWHKRGPIVLSVVGGFGKPSNPTLVRMKRAARRVLLGDSVWHREQTLLLSRVSRVICLNEHEAAQLAFSSGLNRQKFVVIPNGVDASFKQRGGSEFQEKYSVKPGYVLFVGAITKRKNPLLLAKALKEAGVSGVFIGPKAHAEAEYCTEFESLVRSTPSLKWIEAVPSGSPLLISAYSGAGMLCLPSERETQPLVALEAAASGCPVVLPDLPYARSNIYAGAHLFEPITTQAIEAAVSYVLRNRGSGTIEPSAVWSWSQVANRVTAVYQDALNSYNAAQNH